MPANALQIDQREPNRVVRARIHENVRGMEIAMREVMPVQLTRQPSQCASQFAAEPTRVACRHPLVENAKLLPKDLIQGTSIGNFARDQKTVPNEEPLSN